jgi:hypothetical protein
VTKTLTSSPTATPSPTPTPPCVPPPPGLVADGWKSPRSLGLP